MRKLLLLLGVLVTVAISFLLGKLVQAWVADKDLPYLLELLLWLATTLPLFAIFLVGRVFMPVRDNGPAKSRRHLPRQRYNTRLITFAVLHVVMLMASDLAIERFHVSVQLRVILAVLTALPLGGLMWAVISLMADPQGDEFERTVLARSLIYAAGMIMFFAAIWGFLENFAQAPDFPLYLMIPLYFVLFGLTQPFVRGTYK